MSKKFVGIEIGGTKFQAIVADSEMNIVKRVVDTVGEEKEATVIQKKIELSISGLISEFDINSIGVGFGGPVDMKNGRIFTSYHVNGWNNFDLRAWLSNMFNLPVYLDNDANTAALAEARLGCGSKHNRVFYITLGSGVGGGFIVDGEVYHGNSLGESEFGHVLINKKGKTIESSCSGWALNEKLDKYIIEKPDGILANIVKYKNIDASKCVIEAIEQGDSRAKIIFDEMVDDLAFGLSHVVHLLNPDIIIIGGGLSFIGEYITNSILENLPKYLMSSMRNRLPEIKIAQLKEDVVPIGAILLANGNQVKKME